MLSAALGDHVFWITSRAAGVAALIVSSAAVCVGLLMSGTTRRRIPDLRVVHEALSLATLAALTLHALSLLGDSFMAPSLADITIPFVSGYQRFWTSMGIVAGWMLMLLGLSYYVRGRIGPARWRKLHRFTALAWVLGVGHAVGEGTDAGAAWFLLTTAVVVLPAAALLAVRLSGTPAATPAAR
jgi:sulfoxide reductase heme-binding subunit YedZ